MLNIILFGIFHGDFPVSVQMLSAIDILRKNNIEVFFGSEGDVELKEQRDALTSTKHTLDDFVAVLHLDRDEQTKYDNNDFYAASRAINTILEHLKKHNAPNNVYVSTALLANDYTKTLTQLSTLQKLQTLGIKAICIDDVAERKKAIKMRTNNTPLSTIATTEHKRIDHMVKSILNICDKMDPSKHSVLFIEVGPGHLHRLQFNLMQQLQNEKNRFVKQGITITPFHFFTQHGKLDLSDSDWEFLRKTFINIVDSPLARDFYKENPIIEEKVEGEKIGATLNKLLNRIIKTKTDLEINNAALQRTMKSQSQTPTTSTDTHSPLQSKPLTFAFNEEVFDLPPLPCLVEPMLSLKRVGLLS